MAYPTIYTTLSNFTTYLSYTSPTLSTMFLNTTSIAGKQQPTPQEPLSKQIVYGIFILNGILALFGVLGNIFVCMIIIRGRKMYTIANLFLMNLAIADMCVLIVSYPLWIIQRITPFDWPFGSALCKIIPSVSDAFYGVSLGCMTTISIHRYRMILHAMDTQLTFFQAKIIIIFIWLISLASIAVPLYPVLQYYEGIIALNATLPNNITSLQETPYKHCRSMWPSRTYERSYQTFLTLVWYILPLLIILITFLRIKCYLQKQMAYEWLKGSEHNVLIANHILGIKKALRMLAPVVIIFAILMLPWNILRVLSVSADIASIENTEIYVLVSGTMLVANSVVNPFIYYIMSKEFRIEFRKQFWLLKKTLRLTRESDQYTIEADKFGRKYVRRFQSFIKRDSNGNFSTASMAFPSKTRAESYSSDYTYSNGAPAADYEELFKEQRYISSGENRSHGDFHRNASVRNNPSPKLYSITEEHNSDLNSKDSGFEGCIIPEKIVGFQSMSCDEKQPFLNEEVIRETVL